MVCDMAPAVEAAMQRSGISLALSLSLSLSVSLSLRDLRRGSWQSPRPSPTSLMGPSVSGHYGSPAALGLTHEAKGTCTASGPRGGLGGPQ